MALAETLSTAPRPSPAGPGLPAWAQRLGYAGLIPFVSGAALVWLVHADAHPYATLALSAYAATIVAFLGGIHWGIAFRAETPSPAMFVWGVVPQLVAWVSVVMPPSAGLVVQGVMLVACYAVDRRVYPRHGLQRWLVLRFRLSAGAALACFLGAAGT